MTPSSHQRAFTLMVVLVSVFGVMTLCGAVGAFWWWGVGFDEAEAYGMATRSTDSKMVVSFRIAMAGLLGLVASGLATVRVAVRR